MNIYGGTVVGNANDTATINSIDQPIINEYNHFTTYVEFVQPKVKNVSITIRVEYDDNYTYASVKKELKEAINSLFTMTPYYIGKELSVSDVWQAVNSVAGVKRFIVDYPTKNIHCEPFEFLVLPAANLKIIDIFDKVFK